MPDQVERRIHGIGASEGIALGPIFRYEPPDLDIPDRSPASVEEEMAHFEIARTQAQKELQALKDRVSHYADEETAAIFEAHTMIAADPSLASEVERRVKGGATVEAAAMATAEALSAQFSAMEDEYFAARATDMIDVGRRIVRILLGIPDQSLEALAQPSIIVAYDLTPSDTASLNPDLTLGLCTAVGGLTSHTAILARTLGLPAVVGIGDPAYYSIEDGVNAALDGHSGEVVLSPSEEVVKEFKKLKVELAVYLERIEKYAHEKGQTADGRHLEIAANIGSAESARESVTLGAEGVGLLRTEFLYLEETKRPSEQNQIKIYTEIFEAMEGRPVIVRTLDIGGDKPPSFLEFEEELNPFLGWRAIRICLDDTQLFKTQLRAILRAAVGHTVLIMYPMIINLSELQQANAVLQECKNELDAEGLEYNPDVPVGIMVETPAAAVSTDLLAEEADFFSIGANDLTQYTLAVDRTNQRVAHLYNSLDPAVLRLVKQTIDNAHSKGKWVGMCGEMAGQKAAIPILLGLGLDEFSMVARGIAEAKYLLRQLTDERAKEIAGHALNLSSADEVEIYMADVLEEFGL